jgi:hypothetical protein
MWIRLNGSRVSGPDRTNDQGNPTRIGNLVLAEEPREVAKAPFKAGSRKDDALSVGKRAPFRVIFLFGVFCVCVGFAWWSRENERHHQIHRFLALKTFVEEGAGIGGIVDALRENHTAIGPTTFLPIYTNIFSTRFRLRTNETEFVLDMGRIWTIRMTDGAVTGTCPGSFHAAAELEQLGAIDFSRPLDEAVLKQQLPSEAAELKWFFDRWRNGTAREARRIIREGAL